MANSLKDESAISQQQEALKKNILSILNGTEDKLAAAQPSIPTHPSLSTSYPGLTGVAPPPPPAQDNGNLSGINLDNPNVQKALDNLLSSGSLKSITDTGTTQNRLQQTPSAGQGMHQAMTSQPPAPYGQNQQFRSPAVQAPGQPRPSLPSPGQGLLSHPGQGHAGQGHAGQGHAGQGQQSFGSQNQPATGAPTPGYPHGYGGQGYLGQGATVPPPAAGHFNQPRY